MSKTPTKKVKAGELDSPEETKESRENDLVKDLINDLNKEHQSRIAWNLSTDVSPTHVKRWISTGSKLLDYIISNRRDGGWPEGRIVELYGPPSIGKSHIAIQTAKNTQKMGGIVVYVDTENATNPENLKALGVDVSKQFVYTDPSCTEDVFSVIESSIIKLRAALEKRNVPLTIIWDSLAAVSPKAELLGEYDKDTIGLQARVISKGMRKITQVIGSNNVLLLILNQTRTKIGVMYGDPVVTPGGNAVPFHSSVRISLTGGSKIGSENEMVGINVIARTVKNKVAPPFRKVEFQIHFGKGIVEHEEIFDILRESCDARGPLKKDGKSISISGAGTWKCLKVIDMTDGVIEVEKNFYKTEFNEIMSDKKYKRYVDDLLDYAMIKTLDEVEVEKTKENMTSLESKPDTNVEVLQDDRT